MKPLLEVNDVHKKYGAHPALRGVTFAVNEGEMFGLLGPNGAGKTTLLSILSCLEEPDAGGVRLEGKPLTPGDRAIRHRIGIVPQELAVYEQLTARENLHFFGELYGLGGNELRRRGSQLLEAVGLEQKAEQRVAAFSGGMKRRLNLAVALIHGPKVLLLDEPTVGVDPQSRNHIFEEVRRLNRQGVTVLYTSHYMEEVEALCPRIGIIDHGKLLACDELPNLLRALQGLVRFRLASLPPTLEARLREMPGTTFRVRGADLELESDNVKSAMIRLISLLNEMQIELVHLEAEEPNLERVFLHLTGRALRD